MNDQLSATAAVWMFFACTTAILTLTLAWALSNRHPVRPRPHLTGRAAVPYWYSPTGRQDERGIRSLRD
ncbi:MAG: hypothetical protein ACT4QF_07345 [Sporichthyaceae bacterium]